MATPNHNHEALTSPVCEKPSFYLGVVIYVEILFQLDGKLQSDVILLCVAARPKEKVLSSSIHSVQGCSAKHRVEN